MKDNNNEEPPMDDYGIHQDRLLEICEKIIEKTYDKYVANDYTPKSVSEYRDLAETLEKVWNLTQDILQLDDVIRSAFEAMNDPNNNQDDAGDDSEENTDQ